MHPELEEAFGTELSMPEVFKLFTKHHSGSMKEPIETHPFNFKKLVHTNCTFWDKWKPLFRRLPYHSKPFFLSVDEPFMRIHKALTKEIISWLCDSKRRSNVYLISETSTPTLYDHRNTRAHLFSKICYDAQRFGLPTGINSNRVCGGIDSLIYELAAHYPPYRRILARELIDNPGILELPPRTRFRKLIHEPWQALRESHPQYIISPPVVVLGWDSESLDDKEFLRSILELGSSPHSSSLLWIISIDTNIGLPIQDLLHPFPLFQYFRLPVCYNEGPADAASILRRRFSALCHKHKEMFDEGEVWPSEEQMSQLVRVVAGVLETVEVMIQFVDWEDDGGPKAHLETFLAYMVNSPSPSDERPYGALDHFYTLALSNLPPHLFTVFKQVFAIVSSAVAFSAIFLEFTLACLLSLGKDTLFTVFPHVYRLVMDKDGNVFDYPNPWIRRFLEDPTRAGQFYTAPSESRLCAFQAFLHILRHASNPTAMLKVMVHGIQGSAGTYGSTIDRLRQSACRNFYHIGAAAASGQPLLVSALFHRFDFRCLAHTCDRIDLSDFMKFLGMLYLKRVDSSDIVRIEPVSFLDRQFIDKCEGLAEPLDLEKMQVPQDSGEYEEWVPFHAQNPKYVLLGFGDQTVLVLLAIGKGCLRYSGVSIYTSAMLDYM
ncbi:hypothetical protein AGABI2DRAFT_116521 [Agaricus bisporus var. bisporus H97]|uniref:hypothetical protein n=1 Tax=Agaricus bisporus var. bisporus (strain H97 / ATCC MYA-4626 / FGSC 10389) TaxID=936046 RepID=UPI00029F514F|nr:hypothetical protein AGABI2DRAFT_116521 [Agaricus bisporus var. bisporus H97]EKV49484.1 hypothetical protein AGABI2DRAFT_116521 [Agaricus bisporus var. bisporus H97]